MVSKITIKKLEKYITYKYNWYDSKGYSFKEYSELFNIEAYKRKTIPEYGL